MSPNYSYIRTSKDIFTSPPFILHATEIPTGRFCPARIRTLITAINWFDTDVLHRYLLSRPDISQDSQLFRYPPGKKGPTRESISFLLQRLAHKASGGKSINIATHSLRRGGASTLCQRMELPGYVIKKFGRWSNDEWEKVYQSITTASAKKISECLRPIDA